MWIIGHVFTAHAFLTILTSFWVGDQQHDGNPLSVCIVTSHDYIDNSSIRCNYGESFEQLYGLTPESFKEPTIGLREARYLSCSGLIGVDNSVYTDSHYLEGERSSASSDEISLRVLKLFNTTYDFAKPGAFFILMIPMRAVKSNSPRSMKAVRQLARSIPQGRIQTEAVKLAFAGAFNTSKYLTSIASGASLTNGGDPGDNTIVKPFYYTFVYHKLSIDTDQFTNETFESNGLYSNMFLTLRDLHLHYEHTAEIVLPAVQNLPAVFSNSLCIRAQPTSCQAKDDDRSARVDSIASQLLLGVQHENGSCWELFSRDRKPDRGPDGKYVRERYTANDRDGSGERTISVVHWEAWAVCRDRRSGWPNEWQLRPAETLRARRAMRLDSLECEHQCGYTDIINTTPSVASRDSTGSKSSWTTFASETTSDSKKGAAPLVRGAEISVDVSMAASMAESKEMQRAFSAAYETSLWGATQSDEGGFGSGPGASTEGSRAFAAGLRALLMGAPVPLRAPLAADSGGRTRGGERGALDPVPVQKQSLDIRSVLDVGCGSLNWMAPLMRGVYKYRKEQQKQEQEQKSTGSGGFGATPAPLRYVGVDIAPSVVRRIREESALRDAPWAQFYVWDASSSHALAALRTSNSTAACVGGVDDQSVDALRRDYAAAAAAADDDIDSLLSPKEVSALQADLVVVRDVLFHLSFPRIRAVLNNLNQLAILPRTEPCSKEEQIPLSSTGHPAGRPPGQGGTAEISATSPHVECSATSCVDKAAAESSCSQHQRPMYLLASTDRSASLFEPTTGRLDRGGYRRLDLLSDPLRLPAPLLAIKESEHVVSCLWRLPVAVQPPRHSSNASKMDSICCQDDAFLS